MKVCGSAIYTDCIYRERIMKLGVNRCKSVEPCIHGHEATMSPAANTSWRVSHSRIRARFGPVRKDGSDD